MGSDEYEAILEAYHAGDVQRLEDFTQTYEDFTHLELLKLMFDMSEELGQWYLYADEVERKQELLSNALDASAEELKILEEELKYADKARLAIENAGYSGDDRGPGC